MNTEYNIAIDFFANLEDIDTYKKIVVALAKTHPMIFAQLAVPYTTGGYMEEVRKLVFEGKKVNAIKLYRKHTGTGLKEAKDVIDAVQQQLELVGIMKPEESKVEMLKVVGKSVVENKEWPDVAAAGYIECGVEAES